VPSAGTTQAVIMTVPAVPAAAHWTFAAGDASVTA